MASRVRHAAAVWLTMGAGLATTAHAQASQQLLTSEVEIARVPSVGAAWVRVDTLQTYSSPVAVCTYNIVAFSSPPATVRMRNVGPTGFDIRLQQFEQSDVVTPGDVHCLVVEEGVHTLAGGHPIEAHTVVSTQTANGAPNTNWNGRSENVTGTLGHSYTAANFVVLGQVSTFNDVRASVFWTHDGGSRRNSPTPTSFFVGKHTGQSNVPRANETLGFITTRTGAGTDNGVGWVFGSGADSVGGTANAPPYSYALPGDYETAVATQNAEDGGNGSWAVLWGADPLPNGAINLAVEEEVFAGDATRTHTLEPVFYAAFDNGQSAQLDARKTLAADAALDLPGTDQLYTLEVENTGQLAVDAGGVFLTDPLPPELAMITADLDGPGTGPVRFENFGSGLVFDPATDIGYSDAVAPPTDFSQCAYAPVGAVDPAVRHLCLRPGGRMGSASFGVERRARFTFAARIR